MVLNYLEVFKTFQIAQIISIFTILGINLTIIISVIYFSAKIDNPEKTRHTSLLAQFLSLLLTVKTKILVNCECICIFLVFGNILSKSFE